MKSEEPPGYQPPVWLSTHEFPPASQSQVTCRLCGVTITHKDVIDNNMPSPDCPGADEQKGTT